MYTYCIHVFHSFSSDWCRSEHDPLPPTSRSRWSSSGCLMMVCDVNLPNQNMIASTKFYNSWLVSDKTCVSIPPFLNGLDLVSVLLKSFWIWQYRTLQAIFAHNYPLQSYFWAISRTIFQKKCCWIKTVAPSQSACNISKAATLCCERKKWNLMRLIPVIRWDALISTIHHH